MKKLIYLLIILIGFVACKKENTAPAAKANGGTNVYQYDKMYIESFGGVLPIDSVKYVNLKTGHTQLHTMEPNVVIECLGQTHDTRTYSLVPNLVTSETCEVTIYFKDNSYKLFQAYLAEPTETSCDVWGALIQTYDKVHIDTLGL